MERIDSILKISENKNSEVLYGFYHAALKVNYSKIFDDIYKFLGFTGRMKFVLPTFRALADVNKEKAVEVFESNKNFYHAICTAQIKKILG